MRASTRGSGVQVATAVRPPVRSAERTHPGHPKHLLYEEIYEPLTAFWFEKLAQADDAINEIRGRATPESPRETLEALNELFHTLVDQMMADLEPKRADRIVEIITEHHLAVDWMEPGGPKDLGPTEILESMATKLKRNISLAAVETTIFLESACRYARSNLDLRGDPLEQLLRRSRQLYASLAVLHDNQEQQRVRALTGITGILEYPETDYHHVLAGEVAIGEEHFVVYGDPGQPKLRFATAPAPQLELRSPTKRCPAQRPNPTVPGNPPFNDQLWDLLIAAYRDCGRFR